jgi:hypothetical protein
MREILGVVLAATIFLCAAPGAAIDEPVKTPKDTGFSNVPIDTIAAEFREIRKIKGHFGGGQWNDNVDRWGGRKHKLMIELGERLSREKYSKNDMIKLMDPPDQIARTGDDLYRWITSQPGNNTVTEPTPEYLVYYWRGKHDFLYFTCMNGAIINSGWWHAWE